MTSVLSLVKMLQALVCAASSASLSLLMGGSRVEAGLGAGITLVSAVQFRQIGEQRTYNIVIASYLIHLVRGDHLPSSGLLLQCDPAVSGQQGQAGVC